MSSASFWQRLPLGLRLGLFRTLEVLGEVRKRITAKAEPQALPPGDAVQAPSLWIFVSTIGELNAIEPFIERLLAEMGQPALTLLSDRAHYGEAYKRKYPAAHLEIVTGASAEARALVKRRPPLFLLVAEIPCLLHDAPCRFSYALLHAAKQAGAPAVLVNGWLYGYAPPSRLDAMENRLFARDYLRAYDLMTVQTEEIRSRLIAAGAEAARVVVTGNIKFDAMSSAIAAMQAPPLSNALQRRGEGPVIVAGSVTETADQRVLLSAFQRVLTAHPAALLVLAPRHPENRERMAALQVLMEGLQLKGRLRSQHPPDEAARGPVLVLDTMGELRGCYAAATLAYVGTDHNVLEPLSFGKPVFVSGVWEATYPSYPVYEQLLAAGVLNAVGDADDLAAAWLHTLGLPASSIEEQSARLADVLAQARGAVARCLQALHASGLLLQVGPATGQRAAP